MNETVSDISSKPVAPPHVGIRPEWLALRTEPAREPALPIIDAHHHLWELPDKVYRVNDLLDDMSGGHNIRATVFIECKTHYDAVAPAGFEPLGEVRFACDEARKAQALGAHAKVAAAIVANADLLLGDSARPVLERMVEISGERVRGIRNIAVWHADPSVRASAATPPQGLVSDKRFREGFRHLAPLGLSFDAWLVHTQIDDLCALAEAFPDTPIVLNHVGGPLALGPYRGHREEVFEVWKTGVTALSHFQNVNMKLGGFGMPLFGFGFQELPLPPDSQAIAVAIRPYVETCIELFGATRCMFESNFPVDKGCFSYAILWNAYKRLTAGMDHVERTALFYDTAARFYRIGAA
jgi:predicted TIM-barrel fold metal-dependent hydrolase